MKLTFLIVLSLLLNCLICQKKMPADLECAFKGTIIFSSDENKRDNVCVSKHGEVFYTKDEKLLAIELKDYICSQFKHFGYFEYFERTINNILFLSDDGRPRVSRPINEVIIEINFGHGKDAKNIIAQIAINTPNCLPKFYSPKKIIIEGNAKLYSKFYSNLMDGTEFYNDLAGFKAKDTTLKQLYEKKDPGWETAYNQGEKKFVDKKKYPGINVDQELLIEIEIIEEKLRKQHGDSYQMTSQDIEAKHKILKEKNYRIEGCKFTFPEYAEYSIKKDQTNPISLETYTYYCNNWMEKVAIKRASYISPYFNRLGGDEKTFCQKIFYSNSPPDFCWTTEKCATPFLDCGPLACAISKTACVATISKLSLSVLKSVTEIALLISSGGTSEVIIKTIKSSIETFKSIVESYISVVDKIIQFMSGENKNAYFKRYEKRFTRIYKSITGIEISQRIHEICVNQYNNLLEKVKYESSLIKNTSAKDNLIKYFTSSKDNQVIHPVDALIKGQTENLDATRNIIKQLGALDPTGIIEAVSAFIEYNSCEDEDVLRDIKSERKLKLLKKK